MAKMKDMTKAAVRSAKKTVARARTEASALASQATDKLTGRAKKKKRVKAALAIAGVAVVAAAGVSLARRKKR
jgi:hypothetical protein